MNNLQLRRLTGSMLVIVPIVFTLCFTLLQVQFEYPDILRQPAEAVLRKFQTGGTGLIATWYTLTLTALLFVPLVILVHLVVQPHEPPRQIWLASTFGVMAGLVQALGFIRWPFLVPHLASIYLAPETSTAQREAAVVVFEAFHRYAGMAIGEHLGYLCTGVWTWLIAGVLWQTRLVRPWLGVSGMLLAGGIVVGVLEMVGWAGAGPVNAISYLVWAVWLVVVGVVLLRGRGD